MERSPRDVSRKFVQSLLELKYFAPRLLACFSLSASLAVLSQTKHVVAGGPVIIPGRPYPSSSLHFPKASAKYDTPPKLISGDAPLYPVSQSRSGNSGFAVVGFTVG